MYQYFFKNLLTNEIFHIDEDNYEVIKTMIRKAKYSKKISYLGRSLKWG